MKLLTKIAKTIQGNFAIFTIVISLLGYFVPGMFLWATDHISLFMAIVMFGMSLTMEASDFKEMIKRPKPMIAGVLLVYISSCIITYITVNLLNLPDGLAIGLLLCAACPGGVITNVLTFIAKGDVPLSVGLTSVGTVLAPVVTPLLALFMVGQRTEVDGKGMIISMLTGVVLPLVIGLTIKAVFKKGASKVQEFSPLLSLLSLSIIIGGIVAKNGNKLLGLNPLVLVGCLIFIIVPTIVASGVSHLLKISTPQSHAIGIETGFKNSILASILATGNFSQFPEAALPGVIIALLASIIGPILANIWAKNAGIDEKEQAKI